MREGRGFGNKKEWGKDLEVQAEPTHPAIKIQITGG
jgi:hypothetical protein